MVVASRDTPSIRGEEDQFVFIDAGFNTPEEEETVRRHLEAHLELLAQTEHEGWMKWHLKNKWRYGPKRNNKKRLHPCLLPFPQLNDADKNKDRTQVRHYPDFARRAGKKIVFKKYD